MSIQVEKIHLRDANDWVALPEWTYESAGGSTVVLSDILEGSSSSYYGVCETAAGTAAKEAFNVKTKTGKTLLYSDLYNGLTITIRFVNSNTASNPTLNVNSIGNFPIYRYGTTVAGTSVQNSWPTNGIVSLTYDNALRAQGCWVLNDVNYDTDTKVTQTVTSADGDYPIILKATTATATVTTTTIFGAKIKANPNSGNISASTFNGFSLAAAAQKGVDNSITTNSTSTNLPTTSAVAAALPKTSVTASKDIATTSSAGTTAAGTPYAAWNHVHAITKDTVTSALGYTPPTTDTNTHYTSKNIVAATSTATANASAADGSVYLNHLEETTVKSSHNIRGAGATTVTADNSGNIIITSTDNNTTYTPASSAPAVIPNSTASVTGTSVNYAREDHTHGLSKAAVTSALGYTPPTTNTTYSKMTASDATAGIETTGKLISADVLQGERASWYITSTAAATTTAKTATMANYKLKTGTQVIVNFENKNTVTNAPITLNISSTGAKTIYVNGAATSSANQLLWDANSDINFIYDGTYYRVVSAPVTEGELTTLLANFE